MTILLADNISVGYQQQNKKIIENLSFKLNEGEFICLMGPNGSGKTTLLKSLSTLAPLLGGKVEVFNKNINDYDGNSFAKKVSIVLTDQLELRHMTVFEVVSYGRFPYTNFWGTLSAVDKKHVDEAIELSSLNAFKERLFDKLSDGEKQKVLIARAIAQDTPIMFLDEPTTFLDISHKVEVLTLLKILSEKKKKTILFSSHDWDIVSKITPKIWIFDKENKMHEGTPEEIIRNGLLEKSFNLKPEFVTEFYRGQFN